MIFLETKNLEIRNFTESDWKDLHEYLSLPDTYLFEPGNPIDEVEAKKLANERSSSDDFLAVILKNENKMIGHLYFSHVKPEKFLSWEIGFIFNPKYRNNGYCTEASGKLIEYAFSEMKVHKIIANCNPKNTASWKVLEKIGMKKEGFFKQKAYFKVDENNNPLWHDCFSYGLLSEEFIKK